MVGIPTPPDDGLVVLIVSLIGGGLILTVYELIARFPGLTER